MSRTSISELYWRSETPFLVGWIVGDVPVLRLMVVMRGGVAELLVFIMFWVGVVDTLELRLEAERLLAALAEEAGAALARHAGPAAVSGLGEGR